MLIAKVTLQEFVLYVGEAHEWWLFLWIVQNKSLLGNDNTFVKNRQL